MTGVKDDAGRELGDDLADESTRRRLFAALARGEDEDGLTERFVQQWAHMRAERRAEPPAIATGPSNFTRAQVPWGLDLAAAWAWRLSIIVVAVLGLLWTMRFFAVITVPIAIALLDRGPRHPARQRRSDGSGCPAAWPQAS